MQVYFTILYHYSEVETKQNRNKSYKRKNDQTYDLKRSKHN